MKVILVGYPGSQFLRPASDYLFDKYMNFRNSNGEYEFDPHHYCHEGPTVEWSQGVIKMLNLFDDERIILALDDYLMNAPINQEKYQEALKSKALSVKLCENTREEFASYPITTQYTIWDRVFLIGLLEHTSDPWNFEIHGSELCRMDNVQPELIPCLSYYTNSALSSKWQGIDMRGLKEEDIIKVIELCQKS